MQTFRTPLGKAGSDQLYGMEEAVHSDIRAMFQAGAERDALDYRVGLTVDTGPYRDSGIRLEARRRECDARITSSAGRAVERALKLVHACGTDRIIGREFPGVDEKQMERDTKGGHGLTRLRQMILDEMSGVDMENALEDSYQRALNPGLVVVTLDDEHLWTVYASSEDIPLREHTTGGISDGEEYTIDHTSVNSLLFRLFDKRDKSEFAKLSVNTLVQFLEKADQAYYERDGGSGKRRSLHWEAYSARDHERSRPYVVAGMRFFARLAKELVQLSMQYWVSDRGRLVRDLERANYKILRMMKGHAKQRFGDEIVFPPMIPAVELAKRWVDHHAPGDSKAAVERGYDHLRQKQKWVTDKPANGKT